MSREDHAITERPPPLILPARPSDLRAVYRIAETAFPVPWPFEELQKELHRPFSGLRVLRPASDAPIAGFLNYWRVADELQIMNVAVLPELRRFGYGGALLRDLLQQAQAARASAVLLEVRRSNAAAISLYERYGFAGVGVRQRYYSDNGEDALVMRVALGR
jgi:ribosomal-protein-alanine N-acetyltransferase